MLFPSFSDKPLTIDIPISPISPHDCCKKCPHHDRFFLVPDNPWEKPPGGPVVSIELLPDEADQSFGVLGGDRIAPEIFWDSSWDGNRQVAKVKDSQRGGIATSHGAEPSSIGLSEPKNTNKHIPWDFASRNGGRSNQTWHPSKVWFAA